MIRVFKKTGITAVLCVLLSAIILLCSCGQITFIQSVKSGMEIQKGDFEITANVKTNEGSQSESNEVSVKLSGTINNEQSMYMDVSMTTQGEEHKVTTIILDKNILYMDIEQLFTLLYAGTLDISEALTGKKYIYVDLNELSKEYLNEAEEEIEYNEANVKGIGLLLYKLLDVVDKSAQNTDPAVLSQKENKYTFSLTEKNIEGFLHNLATVLEEEKNWLFNEYVNQLKFLQAQELADEITKNQEDISKSYDEFVATLKEFSLEGNDTKFDVEMYSQLDTNPSKVWSFGISGNLNSNEFSGELSLDMKITENTEDKELPSVSKDEAIAYDELSSLLFGSADSGYSIYGDDNDYDFDDDFNFDDYDFDDNFTFDSENI